MSAHGMRHQIDEVDEVDWLPTVITPTNHTRFVVDCREEDSTTWRLAHLQRMGKA